MRILYLSCHSILEFDEVDLFNKLGHYVFSPGAYVEPRNPGDASLRPGLMDIQYDPADVAAWNALGQPGRDNKECLTKEFVDRFDVVVVMHLPQWISKNWAAIKHKPVVWRTIGQSISNTESTLKPYRDAGLKIVRYSPRERGIPGFIGEDAVIRFYKDSQEYNSWNGNTNRVITFNQSMPQRVDACNYELWKQVMAGFDHRLYGPGNEAYGNNAVGKVSFDDLKAAMRDNRAYFYVGTHPASYTLNFMEAMMTGTPVVAIGPKHGNAHYFPGHDLYEIPDFIQHGENGFISDDVAELRHCISELLDAPMLAARIGAQGRRTAISLFDKPAIAAQWDAFFKTL